ncbi:MAG TPA: ribonuclease D [Tepidisphaeraceae bacterium]|nr:ribonuclease D [Tepidisphaeraceae bacterium]
MSNESDLEANVRRARFARAGHRARQHADAHSDDADAQGPVAEHPAVPQGNADLVTTQDGLSELLDHLRDSGSFAYDSEFIGELTYVPKLCLVQVATATRVSLIDPLAGVDLMPFWELVADASVEKITHAGQQDVEPVIRHLSREARSVFDTQIACGFIGMAYPVALSKLVNELVGAKLGKGLTFTHWDQRPLSPSQLRYAADDVRYLPALRQAIGRKLEATGHADWAREEFDAMCDAGLYQFDPDTAFLRVRGATSLNPPALAVLRELVIWRDREARAHDVPPRAFLKDEILIDLSRSPVKHPEKLARVRGLPRPVESAHGKDIIDATQRGLATPPGKFPFARPIEPSPTERFRGDAVWAIAQCLCIGQSIDPALATSRQEVGEFYRHLTSGKETADSPIMKGWRRAALGQPLTDLITSGGKVSLDWNEGALRVL